MAKPNPSSPGLPHENAVWLSPRERQVLELLVEALAYKRIAHELGIAEGTVKGHIAAMSEKLGLPPGGKALMRFGLQHPQAVEHGVVQLGDGRIAA